jgi:hypothetical protein
MGFIVLRRLYLLALVKQVKSFVHVSALPMSNYSFTNFCSTYRSVYEVINAISLCEALLVREGCIPVENFSLSEVNAIIAALSR